MTSMTGAQEAPHIPVPVLTSREQPQTWSLSQMDRAAKVRFIREWGDTINQWAREQR